MKLWFNELVVSQQGTLFENDLIKVSCRHAYQNAQIKLALYVGNKSASGALTSPRGQRLRIAAQCIWNPLIFRRPREFKDSDPQLRDPFSNI